VALNKMDKPGANPEMVKQQLNKEGVIVESLGGEVPSVEISAKTGKGIKDLLDLILLVAEIKNLKTDLSLRPEGVIIESCLDNKRGPTFTAILEQGILKKGDIIGTNSAAGKVRSLRDFQGKEIEQAFPSQPVVIVGFDKVPATGERFFQYLTLNQAKENIKEGNVIKPLESSEEEGKPALNLIIKADAIGSLEAIIESLRAISQEKVALRTIKLEVGNVNENDVNLAKSSKAVIFAFRVKKDNVAEKMLERDKIKCFNFDLIYDLIQKTKELMERKIKKKKPGLMWGNGDIGCFQNRKE